MEDSRKKQIKFQSEHYSESPAAEQHEDHSYFKSEERRTRQTALEEFFSM